MTMRGESQTAKFLSFPGTRTNLRDSATPLFGLWLANAPAYPATQITATTSFGSAQRWAGGSPHSCEVHHRCLWHRGEALRCQSAFLARNEWSWRRATPPWLVRLERSAWSLEASESTGWTASRSGSRGPGRTKQCQQLESLARGRLMILCCICFKHKALLLAIKKRPSMASRTVALASWMRANWWCLRRGKADLELWRLKARVSLLAEYITVAVEPDFRQILLILQFIVELRAAAMVFQQSGWFEALGHSRFAATRHLAFCGWPRIGLLIWGFFSTVWT